MWIFFCCCASSPQARSGDRRLVTRGGNISRLPTASQTANTLTAEPPNMRHSKLKMIVFYLKATDKPQVVMECQSAVDGGGLKFDLKKNLKKIHWLGRVFEIFDRNNGEESVNVLAIVTLTLFTSSKKLAGFRDQLVGNGKCGISFEKFWLIKWVQRKGWKCFR